MAALPVGRWVVFVAAAVGLGLLGLSTVGVRRYVARAKKDEAGQVLVSWADGLARCGERAGKLPPSTEPEPQTNDRAHGPVRDVPPAYLCAGLSLSRPPPFQYSWELRSPAAGIARGLADLNGDGVPDFSIVVDVTCDAGKCTRGVPSHLGDDEE